MEINDIKRSTEERSNKDMSLTVTEQLIEDLRPALERIIEKAWTIGFVAGQSDEERGNDDSI